MLAAKKKISVGRGILIGNRPIYLKKNAYRCIIGNNIYKVGI